MDSLTKQDFVIRISKKLKISERQVKLIIDTYIDYIKQKLEKGESVGVMRICRMNVVRYDGPIDTFAYVCTEVSMMTGIGREIVKGVLYYYEECIITELRKFYTIVITGVLRLKLLENGEGGYQVEALRSSSLCPKVNFKMVILNSFRRKVLAGMENTA